MKLVILAAALLLGTVSYAAPPKIVGGSHVSKGDHPYQIHLRRTITYFGSFESSSWGCGGSIISATYILTAAHCVKGNDRVTDLPASKLLVRVGQHNSGQFEAHAANYQVKRVASHALYNPNTYAHDIALLELVDPIVFTDLVQPIDLATVTPPAGAELTVSGWGTTSSGGSSSQILQSVNVHVVSRAACNAANSYYGQIVDGMLCAAADGRDSCQGDSGGPLVCSDASGVDTLVGVVSWGRGCAFANYPGVYADVAYYGSWIQQNMA
ncbi:trypsin alpha-3-like [Paramacrobiotus metropolitanus]|uniref:trypsin alpha-3-like n=1 Tax=Paramacrobiotus metropolitanus TaxID=2943436 RepID=UPI0024457BAA|nr:trypsin alpha-3-like [Paramacrobiotus metropolitanus]